MPVSHGLFTLLLSPPKPANDYISWNSSRERGFLPNNFCIFTPQKFDLFSNIAPQSGTMPSLDHRLNSWESIQKRAIHIIYPFTRGMSYTNILFVSELTSLESRHDQLSRSFFQDITHPSSSLYHLLPHPRDTSVLSWLRTATRFARPISRTKKYCSFINYTLNHYQVPPRNS